MRESFSGVEGHLANLPDLVKPEPGERLWVYLSTTEHAVSSVLIKEETGDQKPVYYVSHALRGLEARYSDVEKMALALVLTARKIRPYFLSHPVTVLTNSLLGRVMTHPDTSGRLVKWAVDLGEYDVEYQTRVAIKAHALSDFLTEVLTFGQEEVWRLFVDGASSLEESGVGVVLISPTQEKTQVAMKLHPSKSNNEAEYKAVIAGLKLVREAGAEHVIIYSDSQLVVKQVQGTNVKEERLRGYLELVKQEGGGFSSWSIEKIPREHNSEADALAKMATSLSGSDSREVIQQTESVLIVEEGGEKGVKKSWMNYLLDYLQTCSNPGSLQDRSPSYGRDITPESQEIGCCGDHGGVLSLSRRTLLAGYWWPTLQQDSQQIVSVCEGCQRFGNFSHKPASELQEVWASCTFDQWVLDIVGPFPLGPGQKKFLLVAVDYFSSG
ncbi:uncharacterized protein [Henckelia pumila]|uniref:uncharacterized protein n=1 Tax=Henckelia pumila TaxID=405737 RepID=UPI003C6E6CFB